MLAYDDLQGSEGRKVWYRPPRYDAARLFPGRPPRVRLRARSYLLQNISLGGVAAVSKDAAIAAERRDTRKSHSLGAYPPASYHNVPSLWSRATALAVPDIGTDSRVQYWEAAKWVARLRRDKTDSNLLLLKTDLGAGHGGMSGRYQSIRDVALEYAFLFRILGIAHP